MKEKIVLNFAHANGFPAGSYKKFFRHFPENVQVLAKPKYGHEPAFPVSKNWSALTEELIHYVESNTDEKVYALGHSFGGVISFKACCARPDLFKGLIMLDPPLLTGWLSRVFRLVKRTPLVDRLTPAGKAKIRKTQWQANENVVDYFKGKALFKNFDQECIQDYVDSAIEKSPEGQELNFKAQIEADIFRNVPHNLHDLDGALQVPTVLISAENSSPFFINMAKGLVKKQRITHRVFKDVGHLFPMEHPRQSANVIMEIIEQWQSEMLVGAL